MHCQILWIGPTGDRIDVEISRSSPAAGLVSVGWHVVGVNGHIANSNFAVTEGVVYFEQVSLSQFFPSYCEMICLEEMKHCIICLMVF